jgi:hypothetical protein
MFMYFTVGVCISLYVYVWLPWLRFFRAFSSVVRQMPEYNPQRRGPARTLPNFCVVLCIFCVVLCIFVLFYVFLCCSMYFLCRSMYLLCCSMYFCVVLCIFCVVLCIFCVVLCIFVLFYVFLCCSMYWLFCDLLSIVCVYMCTVLLPPGGYPIAVSKYISYHNKWMWTKLR